MQGKTHMPLGIAVATAITPTASLPTLVAGIGAAAIGAVLSDIDAGQSGPHKKAAVISGVCAVILAALAVVEWRFQLGILYIIKQRTTSSRIAAGVLVFLAIFLYGMHQPHRGIMHSITAWGILTLCVFTILPPIAPYFSLAFASHVAIDLLNRRGEQLLWPLPKRFCFGVCRANGFVDHVICLASTACAVLVIAVRVYLITKHLV